MATSWISGLFFSPSTCLVGFQNVSRVPVIIIWTKPLYNYGPTLIYQFTPFTFTDQTLWVWGQRQRSNQSFPHKEQKQRMSISQWPSVRERKWEEKEKKCTPRILWLFPRGGRCFVPSGMGGAAPVLSLPALSREKVKDGPPHQYTTQDVQGKTTWQTGQGDRDTLTTEVFCVHPRYL